MNLAFTLMKVFTVAFYVIAAFAPYIAPVAQYASELMLVAGILLVIHASEFVAIKNKLLKIEPNALTAFINTFIFGVTYWMPLFKQHAANAE